MPIVERKFVVVAVAVTTVDVSVEASELAECSAHQTKFKEAFCTSTLLYYFQDRVEETVPFAYKGRCNTFTGSLMTEFPEGSLMGMENQFGNPFTSR